MTADKQRPSVARIDRENILQIDCCRNGLAAQTGSTEGGVSLDFPNCKQPSNHKRHELTYSAS